LLAIVAALAALAPGPLAAHELDEYLQASRVSLARDRVVCEIDLTPGAEIADRVKAVIDRDGDGRMTSAEAQAYGLAVVRDLTVELDGRRLSLALERVELPGVEEMASGTGTIRIRAASEIANLPPGRRHLRFRNDHRAKGAVYLVNALVSPDRGVVVTGQSRDQQQHEIRLEYDVAATAPPRAAWLLAAGTVMWLLITVRRRHAAAGRRVMRVLAQRPAVS
jgi:hypothetical protein